MEKPLTLIEFMQKFNSEDSCKAHLGDQKWGCGFTCRRCGSKDSAKGHTRHHRRRGSYRFDESATSNTLFHKIKFPLPSALAMVHILTTTKQGMSSCKMARQFVDHQETAWFFKRKVQLTMETCEDGIQLAENIEIQKRGKLKRCRATVIEESSGETLKQALDETITATAAVTTDGWKGYLSAMVDKWQNIEVSADGANFEALHCHTFNLKNWVRGIHHHISREHLQSYPHEFNFMFNNRLQVGHQYLQILTIMATTPKSSYLRLMAA